MYTLNVLRGYVRNRDLAAAVSEILIIIFKGFLNVYETKKIREGSVIPVTAAGGPFVRVGLQTVVRISRGAPLEDRIMRLQRSLLVASTAKFLSRPDFNCQLGFSAMEFLSPRWPLHRRRRQ